MAIIDKPSDYFNTVLYSGTGSTQSITGVGFEPDLIWGKNRSATGSHNLVDSVRGVSKVIYSNLTDAEATDTSSYNAFGSDGFTMGSQSNINGSGNNIVSWNWKAGTSFTNDASSTGIGSIDSTGSTNTTSGFSIITYTGTGSNGTVAHGLGVAPSMIIVKSRGNVDSWYVYHQGIGNTVAIFLDDLSATSTGSDYWQNTTPTSSVFSIGTGNAVNRSSGTFVAYCFADTSMSKMGSYTGNGDADGTFVYTGFKPAFFMAKKTSGTGAWTIHDNKRNVDNPIGKALFANSNEVEYNYSGDDTPIVDFVSNGAKYRGTASGMNTSGATYIYMAFAENPFVTSTGVPATAR
jgi:hypothetical protein